LKKFEHPCSEVLFIWNFDESIISVLPPGDVPYAAVDEQDSFKGTLSEKIADAVSQKWKNLELDLLDLKIKDVLLFVKSIKSFITL
jgi:hypothetical protein